MKLAQKVGIVLPILLFGNTLLYPYTIYATASSDHYTQLHLIQDYIVNENFLIKSSEDSIEIFRSAEEKYGWDESAQIKLAYENIQAEIRQLIDYINKTSGFISQLTQSDFAAISDGLNGVFGTVQNAFDKIPENVKSKFTISISGIQYFESVSNEFKNIGEEGKANTIFNILKETLGVKDAAIDVAQEKLSDKFSEQLIKSGANPTQAKIFASDFTKVFAYAAESDWVDMSMSFIKLNLDPTFFELQNFSSNTSTNEPLLIPVFANVQSNLVNFPDTLQQKNANITAQEFFQAFNFKSNTIQIKYKDNYIDFGNSTPFINDSGRTMVPIRFISENVGANVTWNENTQSVDISSFDSHIQLTIGKNAAIVNGKLVQMDSKPIIQNGRTYVPLRFVIESLNLNVSWDKDTNTISIR